MSDFTIPKFRLPGFVAAIGQKLPQWPNGLALVASLNAALKMKLLPVSELTALEDKLFRVRVHDTGGVAHFTYRNGLFRPLLRIEREPDLAFAAHLSAYLQLLALQKVPDTLFFNREREISGGTELGLIVKNMLDTVEWPSLPRLPLPSR